MKITRRDLLASDINTLFTRDPGTFFEAILINILWDKSPEDLDPDVIARQRYVFEKWHEYYANSLAEDTKQALSAAYEPKLREAYLHGEKAGRMAALQELPFKKSGFGKVVDLTEVTRILNQLKGDS